MSGAIELVVWNMDFFSSVSKFTTRRLDPSFRYVSTACIHFLVVIWSGKYIKEVIFRPYQYLGKSIEEDKEKWVIYPLVNSKKMSRNLKFPQCVYFNIIYLNKYVIIIVLKKFLYFYFLKIVIPAVHRVPFGIVSSERNMIYRCIEI